MENGWTPNQVKEFFAELRKADDRRATDLDAAQEKAVNAALTAAALAVNKAEQNVQKWQDAANEWRGAMSDRDRQFVTRRELYAYIGLAIAAASAISRYIT
jgi:hypothetical protein